MSDIMNCIEITEPGAPEVLKETSRPMPTPSAGEVLIKVVVAGVNRPDVLQRQGGYPPPPGASDLPGLEIAGEIVALGEGVDSFSVGEEVCALVTGGGYAEYCVAPAPQCLPIPKGLSLFEAAALPETFFTVWANLYQRANLQVGETLLVHGGSSGIGTTALQMASTLGARVITTAGNAEKCDACLQLGAERAVNYKEEDYVEAVKEFTDGKGVNVVLDMVGGDYLPKNIKCLAQDGRHVNIAFLQGSKVELNFMPIMLKRLTLTGSTLRARPVEVKAQIAEELKETVWPLLESGKIKPVIHSVFPLSKASEAHKLMESSQHIGKILLEV
ncbi:MAG: NAD(P)H-quinone oxidoreductase [Alphaproteobacteria bacterium]|nr:NAD(P)H-quinone oxidoreductase [Alphaproteobacteria bacterium]